jgi:spectinomycin phosphotransferase
VLVADKAIDERALANLLRSEFDTAADPVFVPVGGDSWNYRAGRWWLSVRRDRQGYSAAAYEAACELREQGHEFVLVPSRGRSGRIVFSPDGRPVIVSPFTEGRTAFPAGLARRELLALRVAVETLHSATVAAQVPREAFALPFESELADGLARASSHAHDAAGPFASEVARLVETNADRISDWRDEIAALQARCRVDPGRLVLTHAEPEPPNVMVTKAGRLLLLDWGDMLYAPPERDSVTSGSSYRAVRR